MKKEASIEECELAAMLGVKTYCGKSCQFYPDCPEIILEDASLKKDAIDKKATRAALAALLRMVEK